MRVFDASAILAFILEERGGDTALAMARQAIVSTVNLVEVLEKAERDGVSRDVVLSQLRRIEMAIVPFQAEEAEIAAELRPRARKFGISLADVSCLAVGIQRRLPVITAESDWLKLQLDLDIRLIR